jgi:hypothetical protein
MPIGVYTRTKPAWNLGIKTGVIPSTAFQTGHTPANKGTKRPGVGGVRKGNTPWNKGAKGLQMAWNKGKQMPSQRGERHHNWQGGKTSQGHLIRNQVEYKLWRVAVFERDNYTCVFCGRKKEVSGKLNADHIKPFALYPELRFAIDNGRTLCIDCHKTTDSYMGNFNKNYKKL